jgi:hypothetical protein
MRSGIDGKLLASAFDTPGAVVTPPETVAPAPAECVVAALPGITAVGALEKSVPPLAWVAPKVTVGFLLPTEPAASEATPRTRIETIPHRILLIAFGVMARLLVGVTPSTPGVGLRFP